MKKLIAIGILLFGLYLIISLSRSVWDLWKKQEAVDAVRLRVERLRGENDQLKRQLIYTQSDEFVEKQAREKLNLVKPGETLVVIAQSVLQNATASAAPTPVPPHWEQWMKLFF